MALTTRCPNCRTRFRVVSDQLKLRDGLVRCGACQVVFNAQEHLVEDEAAAMPLPSPAPVMAEDPPLSLLLPDDARPDEPAAAAPRAHDIDELIPPVEADMLQPAADEPAVEEDHAPAEVRPAAESFEDEAEEAGRDEHAPPEAEAEVEAEVEADIEAAEEPAPAEPAGEEPAEEASAGEETPAEETGEEAAEESTGEAEDSGYEEPGFVLRARRAQRLARIARVVMSVGAVVLLVSAAGLGITQFRNQLAASFPQAKPVLSEACALLGCRIGLPAHIESVAIESSELQQAPESPGALALSLLLRNHSASAQAWPHLELTLLDAAGKPLVRKVMPPADYLPAPKEIEKGLPANAEQVLKLTLDAGAVQPTDYRVYVFYP